MMKTTWVGAALAAAGVVLLPGGPAKATVLEVDSFPGPLPVAWTLTHPGGTEVLNLTGGWVIHVTFLDAVGGAGDGNSNGRDDVPQELVSLSLTGSSSLGPVSVGLNTATPSLGQIEERANNTPNKLDVPPFVPPALSAGADSFFDVFFEITVGGLVLHNVDPAHMAGVIQHKPPELAVMEAMMGSFAPVALFDENGQSVGIVAAGAGFAVPEPATLALFAFGLAGIGVARRRRLKA